MARVKYDSLSWTQQLALKVMQSGRIPKHVALFMDGNRRWAAKEGVTIMDCYDRGAMKMMNVLYWCTALGIPEVTIYGFSMACFERTPQDVKWLTVLATDALEEILCEGEQLREVGVCFRPVGDTSLFSPKLRSLIARAVHMTKDNNKIFVNIAVAYTSSKEVTHAVKTVLEGVENATIRTVDISEELISECLYTNQSSEIDLFIRTSGKLTFSDFMIWQTTSSCIYFTNEKVLWPAFSYWDLLAAVFYYQRCYSDLEGMGRRIKPDIVTNNSRVITFVNNIKKKRERMFEIDLMASAEA